MDEMNNMNELNELSTPDVETGEACTPSAAYADNEREGVSAGGLAMIIVGAGVAGAAVVEGAKYLFRWGKSKIEEHKEAAKKKPAKKKNKEKEVDGTAEVVSAEVVDDDDE